MFAQDAPSLEPSGDVAPENHVGAWEGRGIVEVNSRGVRYSADVVVIISKSGNFLFRLNNHWHHEDHDIEFSFDGEDFFYIIREGRTPNDTAFLSSGDIPINKIQDCARDALWYALGNVQFLKKRGDSGEIINLFRQPRGNINAYGFRYEAEIIEQEPLMARNLSIIREKSFDMLTPEEEVARIDIDSIGFARNPDRLIRQWESKRGSTDGALTTEVVWNNEVILENGITLPAEFTSTTYLGYPPEDHSTWIVKGEFNSWEFRSNPGMSYRPEINSDVFVQDSRLRMKSEAGDVNELMYVISSESETGWFSKEDPFITSLFREYAMEASIPTGPRPDGMKLVVIVLILISGGIPLLLYMWKLKPTKEEIHPESKQ